MGIKLLNKYLKEKCPSCIQKRYIEEYSGKKLVVDTSIFMYKYKMDDKLHQHIYDMCALFYKNNVKAAFVFDGKATSLKKKELQKRRDAKKRAEETYNSLLDVYNNTDNEDDKEELEDKLIGLKKQFIKITTEDKEDVKTIIHNFGMTYIQSEHEADEVCYYLCKYKDFYGCISDDTDMFAYGCPHVLRNFNVNYGTMTEYSVNDILCHLTVDHALFRKICILSGTDYHDTFKIRSINIYKVMNELFMFYKSQSECIYRYYYNDNDDTCKHLEEIEHAYVIDENIVLNYQLIEGVLNITQLKNKLSNNHFYFL